MFPWKSTQGGWDRILDLMDHFVAIEDDAQLFPKECRTCREEFQSFSEFFRQTSPKEHVFEDCSKTMKRPYTMIYRHCTCGNTLVLVLTEKTFPQLNELWSLIRDVSEETGIPLSTLVEKFARELERYVMLRRISK